MGEYVVQQIHRRLKGHLAEACRALRVPFSVFAGLVDLNQFLLDVAEVEDVPTLAARALSELKTDAIGMVRYVACVAVLDLLDQEFGAPNADPGCERRLKDLKRLVDAGENERAFRQLIKTWYL